MGWKRTKVGSVLKDKEWDNEDSPKYRSSYIKFGRDASFKEGDCINLESAKKQLESLEDAVGRGVLSEEKAVEIRERINKIPDFVLFEMIKVERT